ncbi:Uu.00g064520.m01.CDS01 [Anthostomella pinea]|uniref:Uu.00g064520.m01.CDS01 n=1 Tax=Anthostomella pinea TaxID=933095 RepID=A0AAI8VTJ8_9PEZI|nr:Uu.00g064520.m01.CDS01 [Anthostomella pinea]
MASTLPPPRTLLTSLFTTLTSTPTIAPPAQAQTQPQPQPRPPGPHPSTTTTTTSKTNTVTTNPLKVLPPAYRPLLTTLHVLYPSTLLPALDLLDRRLVTHIIIQDGNAPTAERPGAEQDPKAKARPPPTKRPGAAAAYHLVRSAQPQQQLRANRPNPNAAVARGAVYVVRLQAWNCTCAAFAFCAFPREDNTNTYLSHNNDHGMDVDMNLNSYDIAPASASASASTSTSAPVPNRQHNQPVRRTGRTSGPEDGGSKQDEDEGWEFGGLSIDGTDGSGIASVPCCKHLLACVLAERWSALLGGHVDERVVGREEAAGLVGDV